MCVCVCERERERESEREIKSFICALKFDWNKCVLMHTTVHRDNSKVIVIDVGSLY